MDNHRAGFTAGLDGWSPWHGVCAAAQGASRPAYRRSGRCVDRPVGPHTRCRPRCYQETDRPDVHAGAVGDTFAPHTAAHAAKGSAHGRRALQLPVLSRFSGVVWFSSRSQAAYKRHVSGMPCTGSRVTAGHPSRGEWSGKVPVLSPAWGQWGATGAGRSRRPQGQRLSKMSPARVTRGNMGQGECLC